MLRCRRWPREPTWISERFNHLFEALRLKATSLYRRVVVEDLRDVIARSPPRGRSSPSST